MGIKIIEKEKQASGNFNNGEILEKKPIGFPQDMGSQKPYSNIFYWAHAWTPGEKSIIGLHPHQGFEICSFILNGDIKHYDSKQNKWIELSKGDVQIIRSGNGISHAEEICEKSEIFQIWFDPDISKSLKEKATYDDYKNNSFPILKKEGVSTQILKGKGSPLKMNTENIEIKKHTLNIKKHCFEINKKYNYSFFLLEGELMVLGKKIKKGDFFIISNEKIIKLESKIEVILFEIKSPIKPTYNTYADKFIN
jgi:redox-sensitive bicupin YhaK (pirin superfamily)|tara:strand:- start:352 stop:1107 length:756 start_codon:yes stop_codon:yes gene_type:complete